MYYVVTGAAGFIGSRLVAALNRAGIDEIIAVDNLERADKFRNLVACEISDYLDKREFLERLAADQFEGAVEAVLHQGACSDTMEANGRYMMENNYRYSCVLFDWCQDEEVPFLYASSASVYGDAVREPMDEDHPFNNRNFYGATKIAGEAMATAFHYRYGLPVVGLRYMNVYGPRQDYNGAYIAVIMKMLDAIDRGQGPTILGDGSEAFDFVAVEDCGLANVCAMKADPVDRFYNVGTGTRTSLKELAQMLIELTGCKQPIGYAPRSQATLVRNRIGSPKRASAELGFTAGIDLKDGLRRLIEWRNAHRSEVAARRLAVGLPA